MIERSPRRARRDVRRCEERGLTLVEMLVTIALISGGVVGISSAIATAERSATIGQDRANLEVAMRQVSDFVRSRDGLMYSPCASAASYNASIAAANLTMPAGVVPLSASNPVSKVLFAVSAPAGVGEQTTALQACPGPGGGFDYGVQEIVLKVTSTQNGSLTRTIWKARTT